MRAVVFGDERRIGLWILPLFVMVALLGATLVGGLAVLYYAQQVRDLEETTAGARARLDEAVEDVESAAKDAQTDIDRQLAQARDEFSRRSPIDAPPEAGIYAVSAQHSGGEVRVGSAFTVFSSSSETYLLTTYRVVATSEGGAVPTIDVFFPSDTVTMRVHSFDPEHDMAIAVAEGGPVPVLEWRPLDEPLRRGDALYAVGIAGTNTPTVMQGVVAGLSDVAIVPSVPVNAFTSGGPLVDGSGRVVAVASLDYAPFGVVEGNVVYAPPIRLVCERLLDCTAADVGGLGEEGGSGQEGDPEQPPEPESPDQNDPAEPTDAPQD